MSTAAQITRTPAIVLAAVVALGIAAIMAIPSPLFSGLLVVPALTIAAIFGYRRAPWAPFVGLAGAALLALMAVVNLVTIVTAQGAENVIIGVIGLLWVGTNALLAAIGSVLLLTPQARQGGQTGSFPVAQPPVTPPQPWQPPSQPTTGPEAPAAAHPSWQPADSGYVREAPTGQQQSPVDDYPLPQQTYQQTQADDYATAQQAPTQGQGGEDLRRVGRAALTGAGIAAAGASALWKARQAHVKSRAAKPKRPTVRERWREEERVRDDDLIRRVQVKQAKNYERRNW